MDFALPADLVAYLAELDQFIAREIKPIEDADDNIRFFDHRREWARTDFDNGGLPRHEWEALLRKSEKSRRRRRAPALRDPETLWRQGRLQSLDGGDPRAFRLQGARPAQRSAERTFDRRQSAAGDDARPLRPRRPEGDDRRLDHRKISHHLRPDRARARLGCDPYGNPRGAGDPRRRRRMGDQRREDVDHRHACRDPLRAVRAHLGQ